MEGKLLFNLHLRLDTRDRERPSLPIQLEARTLRLPVWTAILESKQFTVSILLHKPELNTSTFSSNSPGNALNLMAFLFPLPPSQETSAKLKGTHESYTSTVLLPVHLLAMLPACIPTVRGVSETPLSYLLPCTTQCMGDRGDQGDYKEESAFLECNSDLFLKAYWSTIHTTS